jgi:UTP--glucose-1-phosphate uridylyltransferase
MKIKKAILPVAGKGTRFLPATKQVPKELLPILKTPMIQFIVDEILDSDIREIILVTSQGKSALEDFFDRNFELEAFLEEKGKLDDLKEIKEIGSRMEVVSVRQKQQLGLGHAVLCARPLIGQEDFVVCLGDDLIFNPVPVIKQLLAKFEQYNGNIIGVMEVPENEVSKYGVIDGQLMPGEERLYQMKAMVEKPSPDKAPSNLATPGRYVLKNEIFNALEEIPLGPGGEYQLTDAISLMAQKQNSFAYKFEGERYDTGTIEGYLRATLYMAKKDPLLRKVVEDEWN